MEWIMGGRRHGLIRARKAAYYTQESLAYELNLNPGTVGDWERGRSEPLPYKRPKLAKLLGVSREQLEVLLREGQDVTSATPSPAPGPPPAAPASNSSPDPAPSAVGRFTALSADDHARLTVTLSDPRRYGDEQVVALLGRQLEQSMHDDGLLGPARTLPTVTAVLEVVAALARDAPPSVRRPLLSLGARGAEFAGWLHRDSRDMPGAVRWYSQATEWAQEAADLPLQGYLLLKKSQMAYDQRDAVRLHALATAAHTGPWQLPAKVQAEVTQQVARGLAMLGEPLAAVERHLDQAHRWLGRATDASDSGSLSSHYSATSLTLQTASCYIEAGKPRQAADLYEQAIRTPALSHRDQGYFLARHTVALALAGEPDDAATQGLKAMAIAATTQSQRTTRELERALGTLTPWASRPGPRALGEAVRAAASN
ncbi:helix-turn-helix transcriptional regulator [Amycolatopsis sp. lyj-23]|uniref:helix-turn-helix transcriptional regulator n=1 Tax=Amycolatopsis sp. lyj-23 TaxID=2789283 RepID=UPI00397877D0